MQTIGGDYNQQTPVKRWTAKQKSAVVIDMFKGKTTAAEVARLHDLAVAEVEGWIEEAQLSVENGFRARSRELWEQYDDLSPK